MPPVIPILAAAAFSVSTAEFIVSGLLPALAGDLHVTIPEAGLLVTAYAACVAIASPIISALTAAVPRRPMLIGVLAVFVAGQVICALAPSYPILLAGRLFVASAHGMFFSVALVIVGNVTSEATRGRAFALFFTGLTLATILGVPGGTAIGTMFGWRAAFWFVGGLSSLATLGAFLLVPRDVHGAEPSGASLRAQFRQLARQDIYLSYLAIAFDALGYFCFITYQVPLLINLTGIAAAQTPIFLLIAGIGTVAGTILSGRLADWKLMPSLFGVTILQLAVFVAMSLWASNPVAIAIEMFLGGVGIGAFASPIQARIIAAAREAPSLASGFISTAFNVGISGGALAGALILGAGLGYAALPLFGTACMVIAATIVLVSWRREGAKALPAAQ
jgi:DHA1 family inner membrane transport protein